MCRRCRTRRGRTTRTSSMSSRLDRAGSGVPASGTPAPPATRCSSPPESSTASRIAPPASPPGSCSGARPAARLPNLNSVGDPAQTACTSARICAPCAALSVARSYCVCRFMKNCGDTLKNAPRRNALSAVMDRSHATIRASRDCGIRIMSEARETDSLRAASSAATVTPGCGVGMMKSVGISRSSPPSSSMWVMDMHLVSVAAVENEKDPPRAVDVDPPEFFQVSLELVQPNGIEVPQVGRGGCGVKLSEPLAGDCLIHAGPTALAAEDECARRAVEKGLDHANNVFLYAQCAKRIDNAASGKKRPIFEAPPV